MWTGSMFCSPFYSFQVLLAETPLMADLMRALVDFAVLRTPPAAEVVSALKAIVFEPAALPPRVQAQAIREQAMLTLGAVVCPSPSFMPP